MPESRAEQNDNAPAFLLPVIGGKQSENKKQSPWIPACAGMTTTTAFTRRGGPPWPPVSDLSIPVVAIYRDRHRNLGQARGPVPTKPVRPSTPCLNFTPPLRGSRRAKGASPQAIRWGVLFGMAIKRVLPPTASAFAKTARLLRRAFPSGSPTLKGGVNCSLVAPQGHSRGE